MMKEIIEKQRDLQLTLERFKQLSHELKQKRIQWEEALQSVKVAEKSVSKEQQDVVRLGSFSFKRMLLEMTGKYDAQIEKEIEEAAQAEVHFAEAIQTEYELSQEVEALETELKKDKYQDIELRYEDFKEEKKQWIQQNDPVKSEMMLKLQMDKVNLHSLLIELNEAIQAGAKAQKAILAVKKELDTASGYSAWDMLGGGLFVTMMKHSSLDEASHKMQALNQSLRHFETELKDVAYFETNHANIQLSSGLVFADYFMDNFFFDWMVHSQISDAEKQLETISESITNYMVMLHTHKDETLQLTEQTQENYEDLILS